MTGSKGHSVTFLRRVQIGKIAVENQLPLLSDTENAHGLGHALPLRAHPGESREHACLQAWGITGPEKCVLARQTQMAHTHAGASWPTDTLALCSDVKINEAQDNPQHGSDSRTVLSPKCQNPSETPKEATTTKQHILKRTQCIGFYLCKVQNMRH